MLDRFTAPRRFANRTTAGAELAARLVAHGGYVAPLVLALPRGGVPLAAAIAQALQAPLDLLLVRKLGVPDQVELAMGAIAEGGVLVLNEAVVARLRISAQQIAQVKYEEEQELARRAQVYRGTRPAPQLAGRSVILVDDGLATGTTMRAAIRAARKDNPAQIIVAVPVAARAIAEAIGAEVEQLVALEVVDDLDAIGRWYADFTQMNDAEVCAVLGFEGVAGE
ncbi:MAG: phosphoribosyltransferase [Candidatus Viridilinea halotolerans]|uniref:Phosphoribosyltransferase n=1 Tax=Candidatus Viridilinea halotolerans TaxID=2491704 RepID=A0A426U183_9CHLR|nr:MAG: phosphoribosyltransferase [Candidatus Viridilinea halotolerans]